VLTVSSPNLPSFATLQNLGGGNYRVVANPTKDNLGRFDVTIKAADDKGGLTTKTFLMNVVDRNTRSFYIKVGTDGTFGGTPWNDFLGFPFNGKSQANLSDEAGVVSTIGITYRDSWGGTNPLGFITGNNSGVYPDSVLRSYVLATDNVGKRIKFTGLNPTKRYNVVFMGSANDGLNAVAGTLGGLQHMSLEWFRARSGAKLTMVHYPSTSAALNDVISGRVPFIWDSLTSLSPAVAAGQVKLLAVTSPRRILHKPRPSHALPSAPSNAIASSKAMIAALALFSAANKNPCNVIACALRGDSSRLRAMDRRPAWMRPKLNSSSAILAHAKL
jgi:hypothetical protein